MKEYFNEEEEKDFNLLIKFNEQHNLFDFLRRTKPMAHTDAVGTKLGITYNIELKRRYCGVLTYKDVYIEDYKVASMMLDYVVYCCTPLYICFYNDGVLVFNLLKLKAYPRVVINNIESKGKEKTQLQERRYCLEINDAILNEKWNTADYS